MFRLLTAVLILWGPFSAFAQGKALVFDQEGFTVLDRVLWESLETPVLVVPPVDVPTGIEVNGLLLLQIGTLREPAHARTHRTLLVQLPRAMAGPESPPLLRFIRSAPEGSLSRAAPVFLMDRLAAENLVFWRNLFGYQMTFAFAILATLIGLVALGFWWRQSGQKDRSLLLFSLFCFGFDLAYIQILVDVATVPSVVVDSIRIVASPVWVLVLLAYVLSRNGGFARWRRPLVGMFLALAPSSMLAVLFPTADQLFLWGAVSLSAFMIVYGVVILVVTALKLRQPSVQDRIFFLVALFTLSSGVFDVSHYYLLGYKPWILTSPYIMVLVLINFLVLMVQNILTSQRLAAEKTAELAALNANLQTEVERRNQDLQKFVSVLSHDMKNTLFGIRQLSEKAGLPLLSSASHRAEELLISLLRLSSSRAGMLQPQKRAYSLGELWDRAIRETGPEMAEKGGKVVRVGDERTAVQTDLEMAVTILRNFLLNAIKVTPTGGEIRLLSQGELGEICLSVQDFGPGMTTEQRLALFDLGTGRVQTTQDVRSTGFGLILCHDLAVRLGHRLEVHSEPGAGSTFSLIFNEGFPS